VGIAAPVCQPHGVDADQVLAFRLARSGLGERNPDGLAAAAACPASDFQRDAALLAVAARADGVTREGYAQAIDAGELVVAHIMRGAIHALDPADFALYGRALIARDEQELGAQLGRQMRGLAEEKGFACTDALDEVTEATTDALATHPLDKNALHAALRERVNPDLMPWCKGCKSHHVAPMLWRYATVKAGACFDSERRFRLGRPGRAPAASEAARRFLRFYGPNTPAGFAEWAGLAKPHAQRLWDELTGELTAVGKAFALAGDAGALASPPAVQGTRLLPPGDPYLQKPNRALLAPDEELRKRLFRPVASPGAVLQDGRLAGVWRAKAKGRRTELTVEPLGRLARGPLEEEAERLAALRGATAATVVLA
jgi:hypothetical protein